MLWNREEIEKIEEESQSGKDTKNIELPSKMKYFLVRR